MPQTAVPLVSNGLLASYHYSLHSYFSLHCWEEPISAHFSDSLHLLFTKHVINNIQFDWFDLHTSKHINVHWVIEKYITTNRWHYSVMTLIILLLLGGITFHDTTLNLSFYRNDNSLWCVFMLANLWWLTCELGACRITGVVRLTQVTQCSLGDILSSHHRHSELVRELLLHLHRNTTQHITESLWARTHSSHKHKSITLELQHRTT